MNRAKETTKMVNYLAMIHSGNHITFSTEKQVARIMLQEKKNMDWSCRKRTTGETVGLEEVTILSEDIMHKWT